MEANWARGGGSLLAACACVVLAAWGGPARAGALALRPTGPVAGPGYPAGSTFAEFGPGGEIAQEAPAAENVAPAPGLAALLLAGTVCFNPPDIPPDVPPVTTTTTTTTTTTDNPQPPGTSGTPGQPGGGTPGPSGGGTPGPSGGGPPVTPGGQSAPEPASLLTGLIGMACAAGAALRRRRMR